MTSRVLAMLAWARSDALLRGLEFLLRRSQTLGERDLFAGGGILLLFGLDLLRFARQRPGPKPRRSKSARRAVRPAPMRPVRQPNARRRRRRALCRKYRRPAKTLPRMDAPGAADSSVSIVEEVGSDNSHVETVAVLTRGLAGAR